jgi:tRNA-(ms[2]io[6]A)-hydroxylase
VIRLRSSTSPAWFGRSRRDLAALLSDHLHAERKAAENALGLVRRYPSDPQAVEQLTRLAHEETSHCVQVAALMRERGLVPRPDTANRYARGLLALARPRDPEHHVDALLVAALIEARSHERLLHLRDGFAAEGDERLADFYRTLANAEERHAEIFVELAERVAPKDDVAARLAELVEREAEILAALPHDSRVH